MVISLGCYVMNWDSKKNYLNKVWYPAGATQMVTPAKDSKHIIRLHLGWGWCKEIVNRAGWGGKFSGSFLEISWWYLSFFPSKNPTGRFWLHGGESERDGGVEGSIKQLYIEPEKTWSECGAGKKEPGRANSFVLNSQSDLEVDECAEKKSGDAFKNECCWEIHNS